MVFGFLANLTNYGPKDFKGKTVKDILAMKPGKVGDDFFGADNEKAIAEAGLMREQLQAIELLMDLKNKEKIMEKCYVNRPTKRYSVVPGHSSMRKEHGESARHVEAKPVHVEAAKPVEAAPHVEKHDERELVPVEGEQEQGGGGGHKHTRRCGHKRKRSGHKRSGHKRTKHGGHKSRRSHKHTKRCGHKRSGHKRSGHKRSGHKRSGQTGGKGPVLSPRSY